MPESVDLPKVDLDRFASVEDALEKARAGASELYPLAKRIIAVRGGLIYQPTIFMLSAVARAEGLTNGILHAVETENPHVAFPLLRSYADLVMVVMYVRLHPNYMQTVMNGPENLPPGVPRQRSTQAIIAAVGDQAPGFKAVWDELCDMTHFGSLAIWNAWKHEEDSDSARTVMTFTTYPRWKQPDRDPLLACGWLLELSDALITTLDGLLAEAFPAE